jgi:hypothetical protein
MASIDDIGKRKRGRPATDATPVLVRLMPTQIAPLDAWIAEQPDPKPSRPEAIREALTEHLKAKGYLK